MTTKLLIICALICVVSLSSADISNIGERWEGDQYLFSACNVTDLGQAFKKSVKFYFPNVNVTMITVSYGPVSYVV